MRDLYYTNIILNTEEICFRKSNKNGNYSFIEEEMESWKSGTIRFKRNDRVESTNRSCCIITRKKKTFIFE